MLVFVGCKSGVVALVLVCGSPKVVPMGFVGH